MQHGSSKTTVLERPICDVARPGCVLAQGHANLEGADGAPVQHGSSAAIFESAPGAARGPIWTGKNRGFFRARRSRAAWERDVGKKRSK